MSNREMATTMASLLSSIKEKAIENFLKGCMSFTVPSEVINGGVRVIIRNLHATDYAVMVNGIEVARLVNNGHVFCLKK